MLDWDAVADELETAKAIAWDTCHKIYVLMDDEQVEAMRGYGYDPLITSDEMTPAEMLIQIQKWFSDSCGLRFVSSVATDKEDPNRGFKSLIEQGAEDDEDEDA